MPKRTLTAAAVQQIKPPATGQEDHFDKGYPGLALRVSYGGSKSWVYFYRHHARPRRMTLGNWPAMDLKTAREAWRIEREKVATGRDPGAEAKAAKAKPVQADKDLFVNVAKLFIERHARKQNRSWRETARLLGLGLDDEGNLVVRGGVAEAWGSRSIQSITKRDVVEVIDETQDRAPVVAKNLFSALRKTFRWSVARGIIDESPMAGAESPPPPKARDRVLNDSELRLVWLASDGLGFPFAAIVKLLILTGQRREEVAGMRWSEVHLADRLWLIPAERMKKDRPQEVALSDAAIAILQGLKRYRLAGSPFVFSTTGKTAPSGFSRAKQRLDAAMLEQARKEALEAGFDPAKVKPVPDWRLHDLRRSLASGLAALGIRLEVVEKILAHESGVFGGVAGVYQRHSFGREKREALEAWSRFVTGLIEGKADNVVDIQKARS